MTAKVFEIGDRVRFKASFLRNTGQYAGRDACGKWNVRGIDGNFVVVDEEMGEGWFTPDELAADPSLKYRRIHQGNLERCKTKKS